MSRPPRAGRMWCRDPGGVGRDTASRRAWLVARSAGVVVTGIPVTTTPADRFSCAGPEHIAFVAEVTPGYSCPPWRQVCDERPTLAARLVKRFTREVAQSV